MRDKLEKLSQDLNDLLWKAGIFDDKVGDEIVEVFKAQRRVIIEHFTTEEKDLDYRLRHQWLGN